MHHYCDDYVMLLLGPATFLAQARNKTRRDMEMNRRIVLCPRCGPPTKPYADEVDSGSSRYQRVSKQTGDVVVSPSTLVERDVGDTGQVNRNGVGGISGLYGQELEPRWSKLLSLGA